MNQFRAVQRGAIFLCVMCWSATFFAKTTNGQKLILPDDTSATIDKIYAFDLDAATDDAHRLQAEFPNHPIGYLVEAEAMWWKVWGTSAEFKFGMVDARHRAKLAEDQRYFDLAAKASTLALAHLKNQETAEMHFYAGMGDAMAARLYGLRGENRATARSGVRARDHFLRAIELDPQLVDADFGLGLYNYYADTLSSIAKVLSFFMGIPGGNKQEGIRQLEKDIEKGVLTPPEARFYLALNLHRYDQQYERALAVIGPLVEKYPTNPLFLFAQGDLHAKLARKEQALACYRAAAALAIQDPECRKHLQELLKAAITSQLAVSAPGTH